MDSLTLSRDDALVVLLAWSNKINDTYALYLLAGILTEPDDFKLTTVQREVMARLFKTAVRGAVGDDGNPLDFAVFESFAMATDETVSVADFEAQLNAVTPFVRPTHVVDDDVSVALHATAARLRQPRG
jgi:hypothetical protein